MPFPFPDFGAGAGFGGAGAGFGGATGSTPTKGVAIGATGPNQLKAYRRTGMGPCQGRLCGLMVTELMAQARGKTPQEIGYYRLRAPVKPITLAELASVPKTEADIQAVVRG